MPDREALEPLVMFIVIALKSAALLSGVVNSGKLQTFRALTQWRDAFVTHAGLANATVCLLSLLSFNILSPFVSGSLFNHFFL
jgi:hypothetical protein